MEGKTFSGDSDFKRAEDSTEIIKLTQDGACRKETLLAVKELRFAGLMIVFQDGAQQRKGKK